MYDFHATIHHEPTELRRARPVMLRGTRFSPLSMPDDRLTAPLTLSFEAAIVGLDALERMFTEPDGSFVWVAQPDEAPWQLDGQLFDRHERLLYIDLKGTCPPAALERLLRVFHWPATPLVFLLAREAVLLDEVQFRRYAEIAER